jgi:hypothetical protein
MYMAPNPRRIKRFINTFRLLCHIANKRDLLGKSIEPSIFAMVTMITLEYPEVWAVIQREKSFNVCEAINNFVDGKGGSDPPEGILPDPSRYRRAKGAFGSLVLTEPNQYLTMAALVSDGRR